ncbi:protein of unknown function [[Clostridium] ultunense Esp]|uniref:Uncharacterized protein n=1 Tax=[Clostridium] ultunense Esp TaxID=1288971 RepID=A0A1M4PLI1_9FIRM|nr:protein of unknown function [[Clostridium] ultunense Esp]
MERIKNDRNKRELILGLFTFAAFMVLYIFTNFKTAAGINAFLKDGALWLYCCLFVPERF